MGSFKHSFFLHNASKKIFPTHSFSGSFQLASICLHRQMDEDGDHLVNYQEPETWRWAGSDTSQLWPPVFAVPWKPTKKEQRLLRFVPKQNAAQKMFQCYIYLFIQNQCKAQAHPVCSPTETSPCSLNGSKLVAGISIRRLTFVMP